ncbi:MAG TPA: DUF2306 domain-containing protein [Chthoniobacterales bacterium]|jgi:hypothetical protein|nr:DUF2306 domain-containing protein [Chthoniobacterales bacterium]
MDSLLVFGVTRAIHIFFGAIALFVAPAAMATRKGALWHRRWGRIYFWSMAVVAVTAIVMSFIRSGLFFLLVALFSFYLSFTGYRILSRKTPQQRAEGIDWAGAAIVIVGSLALVIYGVYLVVTSSLGTVAIVFGVIGLYFGIADVRAFLQPPADKQAWFFTHLRRMLSAYIATVTAFSVVNFRFLPPVARWLWPTVVGTVGIVLWVGYYQRRFARPKPVVTAAARV